MRTIPDPLDTLVLIAQINDMTRLRKYYQDLTRFLADQRTAYDQGEKHCTLVGTTMDDEIGRAVKKARECDDAVKKYKSEAATT